MVRVVGVLLFALVGGCGAGGAAEGWRNYLATGGTCELQAAAAALGGGADAVLQDVDAAIAGTPALTPEQWAAKAIAALGTSAVMDLKCRAAHLIADLETPPPRMAALMMWRAPCHKPDPKHRPYLEALIAVEKARTP